MTKALDMCARDFSGATKQWADYIKGNLGYDYDVTADVTIRGDRLQIYLVGKDTFQRKNEYDYGSDQVGRLGIAAVHDIATDWDEICKDVWAQLQRAMPRDERELRFSMEAMGGFIEKASSLTSVVGKMIAERVKAARDEATNYMIEHRGWAPAE